MTGVPAHCESCGFVFISNEISVINSFNATFYNVIVTCPKCGKNACVIEGTFDFVDDAIYVKKAPAQTIEILKILQETLIKARNSNSNEEILSEIVNVSPKFGDFLRLYLNKYGINAFIILILCLLQTCSNHTTMDWNELIDQIHQYAIN